MIEDTCGFLALPRRLGIDLAFRVPAADAKSSQEAMNETFLLSNIAPQVGDGFNRHCMSAMLSSGRVLTGL